MFNKMEIRAKPASAIKPPRPRQLCEGASFKLAQELLFETHILAFSS